MSTDTPSTPTTSPPDATAAGPRARRSRWRRRPRVPRHRRVWLGLLAALLVAGGVVGNVALVGHLQQREPMVVLTHPVSWGHQVTEHDVSTVDLPPSTAQHALTEDQWRATVGRVASRPLQPGQLLRNSDLSSQQVPSSGQEVLGLRLTPGRYPAGGLSPNDPIQVVPIDGGGSATSAGSGSGSVSGPGFPARVVNALGPDADGAVSVDVLITTDRAEQASTAAAGSPLVRLLGPSQ